MAVAKSFGDDYQHVDYLPATIVYPLAKTDAFAKVRKQVIAAAKASKPMTDDQVKQAMAKAKPKKLAIVGGKDMAKSDAEPTDDMQEVELRGQKMHDAVALLVEKLEDDFSRFVDLIDGVNFMEFKDALHHARAEAVKSAA